MANLTTFMTPYQLAPVLAGVQNALPVVRPNWLQSFFGNVQSTENTRVNLDVEFGVKNVMGHFVAPNSDVTPIKLPDYGTKEFYFAYSKEAIDSDDFEVLNNRQIGQPFGQVDVMANKALRFARKVALVEQRFENLFEKTAAEIALYGGYQASGEKHPTVRYDFGRTVISTYAQLSTAKVIPSVNLTTTDVTAPWDSSTTVLPKIATSGSFTQGDKAWSTVNIDAKKATPVQDVIRIWETAKVRSGSNAVVMSDDAYAAFNYDLQKNYPIASDRTIDSLLTVAQDYLPRAQAYKGLTFRRVYPVLETGETIAIYTYNAVYNDRITGVETSYIPSGWVLSLPPASEGLKIYGRIMHPRANWQTQPRWMNYWQNSKTGLEEWEYHTSWVLAPQNVDNFVAWKVL